MIQSFKARGALNDKFLKLTQPFISTVQKHAFKSTGINPEGPKDRTCHYLKELQNNAFGNHAMQ
jgi:hypothetical protein